MRGEETISRKAGSAEGNRIHVIRKQKPELYEERLASSWRRRERRAKDLGRRRNEIKVK